MLLVAGGYGGGNLLASTEILDNLAGWWRTVGPLLTAWAGIRGATLNNRIYITGELYTDTRYL